jgi:murein DD-endopeptidase MepM/ murein hydrolase activator NlpD
VVFAGPRIVTGNTVIIEHMPGVYSLCYHLSKISLSAGQMVKAGDSLGAAGSTGFATAAHLHWELRVAGENTDPEAFVGRTILDKDAILSKLGE